MLSKIRVEYDFDKKEPFLQFYLVEKSEEQPDLRDQMLKSFIQNVNVEGRLEVFYPVVNANSCAPQFRITNNHYVSDTSEDFLNFLNKNDIPYIHEGTHITITKHVNLFNLGREFTNYLSSLTVKNIPSH